MKKKFFKQIYIISIIYFCNFAETSLAQTDKKKVIKMLEGRHWILNKNKFNNLGEGADNILIDIAGDNKIINYLRFRALEALALFPTEKTANFLEKIAEKSFSPIARRGFESFSRGFSKTKPKRVKNLALKLLKHHRKNLRIAAAIFIRSEDSEIFKKFIKTEVDPWVRKEALKKIKLNQ